MVRLRMGAFLLVLAWATVAGASSPWVLAMPPLKPMEGGGVPATDDPARTIAGALSREAPITEWTRAQTFDEADACEDERLSRIKAFDDAIQAAGSGPFSDPERKRLTALAREAFSRCVPAFAFSDGPLTSSRE